MTPPARLIAAAFAFLFAVAVVAVPPDQIDGPTAAPAKGSAEEALQSVQVEKGLKVDVWAAEPLLANPVAFAFDEKGRCLRRRDDPASTTASPTPAATCTGSTTTSPAAPSPTGSRCTRSTSYKGFEKYDDQLRRRVGQRPATGKADKSTVFSGGFNRPRGRPRRRRARPQGATSTSPASPTCTACKDTNGDGNGGREEVAVHRLRADGAVHRPRPARPAHGAGRQAVLLASATAGCNVDDEGRQEAVQPGQRARCCAATRTGRTWRSSTSACATRRSWRSTTSATCSPTTTTRDTGDRARWVHIVEGGDSGWRVRLPVRHAVRTTPGVPQGNRGPWNTEKIWHVPGPDGEPPAYVVPPLRTSATARPASPTTPASA